MELSALWDAAKQFAEMDIPQAAFLVAASTAAEEYEKADARLIQVTVGLLAATNTHLCSLPAGFNRRNLTQVTLTSADGLTTEEVRQATSYALIAREPADSDPLFYEFATSTSIVLNKLFAAGTLRFERAGNAFTDMTDETDYPLMYGVLKLFGEGVWADQRAASWRKDWEAQINRDIDTVDIRSARLDSKIFG